MLVGFALVSASAVAKEYAIEVIVFDRSVDASSATDAAKETAKKTEHEEQWNFSSERVAGQLEQMAKLAGKASNHPTSDQLYSLETVRLNLIESGYRILHTISWQQPTSFYQNAPLIPLGISPDQPLDDSMDVLLDDISSDFAGESLSDSADDLANDSLDDLRIEETPPVATGFVRVYTTSLIYADLHLQLTAPMPEVADASDLSELIELLQTQDSLVNEGQEETEAEPQRYYFISEKRRLKFRQVHYFDHPMFGAILGIWEADNSLGG